MSVTLLLTGTVRHRTVGTHHKRLVTLQGLHDKPTILVAAFHAPSRPQRAPDRLRLPLPHRSRRAGLAAPELPGSAPSPPTHDSR
ncbi:hypothetical protein FRACA_810016 [Frankia canadensis]|uniref:Uncharacterized protein n=1 Tax=Frankia canadensis TaxID=1836972 RepID=A0A2I2L1P7_9ACTN|nr:hypothetical protein FRACA_810016 [Frankia canadensis]SOU59115.1 hypothetical protein FRACA_810016 [Frankia canadensis]